MKRRLYSKPNTEEIELEKLMDNKETLLVVSLEEDNDADAKRHGVWEADETEVLPGNDNLWKGWD